MIIDTHIHIWDLDKAAYSWLDHDTSILKQTYTLEGLDAPRVAAGITGGVLVQAANHLRDTDLMLEAAASHDWIKGVVGWMPLMQPNDVAKEIESYKKNAYFKGVRHLIHDEPDATWLLQESVLESLQLLAAHNIPYDLVGVKPVHLETLLKVLARVPDLHVMIDHLNQPPISTQERFGQWGMLMQEVAKHPNVFAKISGLGTTAGKGTLWKEDDLKPYIDYALQTFGVSRCVCGGDWPVSLLASSYVDIWTAYKNILETFLNKEDQEGVFYMNAIQFYQL